MKTMQPFYVNISVYEAAEIIDDAIVRGSMTGECIAHYELRTKAEGTCVVGVYEKHYYRAGNRLTLTVTIDSFEATTRVITVSGGGGEGFMRFDWGAAESFENTVARALAPYTI